ncbi:CARDB domain-containing protein [Halovenus sp. HT40]|uniref:CARDB domain-containing protein n=1 Tax=Halovenus sp. HT40 TaxID=3126691 RepID=UPI00300EA8A5
MTDNSDIREKSRAVFLAAVMVLSMVAMSATFVGGVAALNEDSLTDATTSVNLDDTTAGTDAQYTINASSLGGQSSSSDTAAYISVDFDNTAASPGSISASDVLVEEDGNDKDVAGTFELNSETLVINISEDTLADDTNNLGVVIDGVTNPGAGSYNLALGLHEEDGNSPESSAFTTDTASYDIVDDGVELGATGLTVDTPTGDQTAYTTPVDRASGNARGAAGVNFADSTESNLGIPYGLGPFNEAGSTPNVSVDHTVELDSVPSTGDGTDEIILDFSDSVDAGLDLNVETGSIETIFENTVAGASDVSVTNTSSTVVIEYSLDNADEFGGSGSTANLALTDGEISFEVEEPIEGVDIDGSSVLDHAVETNGEDDEDSYRLVDTGELTLDYRDFTYDDGSPSSSIDTEFPAALSVAQASPTLTAPDDANIDTQGVNAFAGTDITVLGSSTGDSFSVYTADTNDAGELVLGNEVDDVNPVGTAPGDAQTIDTGELPDANGEYFIQHDQGDATNLFYVDLRSLDLSASTDDEISTEDDIQIDVSADDIGSTDTGGQVQAWFYEAGDSPSAANTIHVDTDELNGDGEATLSADPVDDLDGTGEYQAIVAHVESGEFVLTETVNVVEPLDENVEIVQPRQTDDSYARGDLMEFEVNLEGTDTATITFGDRAAGQNVEINYTVQTEEVGGTANFYVNTFQLGDGAIANATVPNSDADGDDRIDGVDWGDEEHGIIAQDGTTVVNAEAHENTRIGGGSNDNVSRRVVIGDGNYDLTASPGETAYTEDEAIATDNSIVRIEERSSGNLSAWNAPTPGDEAAISEIEFVDSEDSDVFDIEAAIEQDLINPQNGVTALNDILVLQFNATGLEGLLADQAEDNGDLDEFLNRNEDHVVTEAFENSDFVDLATNQSADQVSEIVDAALEEDEAENNLPESEDPVFGNEATLDLSSTDVLAGTNDREGARSNLNEYFLTITVDEDNIDDVKGFSEDSYAPNEDVDSRTADDEIPTTVEKPVLFNTTFTLSSGLDESNASEFPENGLFGETSEQFLNWELQNDTVELDDVQETEDGPRLFVPAQDNYTIEGETNIAAGTSMTSQTQTASGEDPAFFYPNEFTVEYVEDGPNAISFSENFFSSDEIAEGENFAGADFRMTIRRSRLPGNLIPNAPRRGLPGTISEITEVNAHTFEDQQTAGATINVAEVNVSESAVVEIRDADGNALGNASVPEGESTNVTVVLDEELEVGQEAELTSVILDEDGNEFSEGPATQTATVEVTEDSGVGTTFLVENLQPVSATVEPGATIEEITADVTNIGSAGEQTVELLLDDEVQDSQNVSLENGESTTVTFEDVTAPDSEGTYTHAIASEDQTASGQLTVEAPEEANFQLSLDSGPSEVETGADITAEVTVENTGGQEATQTITFTFDGEEVGSTEVTLGAGETATESFSASAPDSAGDYDWEIASDDDSISQTLTVTDGGDGDGDDGDSSDDGGPGFGIAAALVALLGAALLAYRRQQN